MADDGAGKIFKKVRRSAADQENKKKVKRQQLLKLSKKVSLETSFRINNIMNWWLFIQNCTIATEKKLLTARDKQLSKEILNKSSTVWLVEETKDNFESATIHHAKPAKNHNEKTDNKLLSERFSTLTKDKLDFGNNEIFKKETKGVSNDNKVMLKLFNIISGWVQWM